MKSTDVHSSYQIQVFLFSKLFEGIFSEANGIWNHVSSRHLGLSFFAATILVYVFFAAHAKKCSMSKWLHIFSANHQR